jgi:protease I
VRTASGQTRSFGDVGSRICFARKRTGWTIYTHRYLGDYYRTYPTTVEDEVRSALARPEDFIRGPLPLRRDSVARLGVGFTVRDGGYLSARWPGDAHRFAAELAAMIG